MLSATGHAVPGETVNRWLPYRRPNIDPAMRLFCFAHAGGSAGSFRAWDSVFPRHIEICAVQLPGRESRLNEPQARRMALLVETLVMALRPLLDKPFALFGHSLGANVAFELARHLRADRRGPLHVFASGCRAPHLRNPRPLLYTLPDSDLIESLRAFGGTPAEVFDNRDLLDWLLPVVRADLELNETYVLESPDALDCPITAFGASGDSRVSSEEVHAWSELTRGRFRRRIFEGNHFFVYERQGELAKEIRQDLDLSASELHDIAPPC